MPSTVSQDLDDFDVRIISSGEPWVSFPGDSMGNVWYLYDDPMNPDEWEIYGDASDTTEVVALYTEDGTAPENRVVIEYTPNIGQTQWTGYLRADPDTGKAYQFMIDYGDIYLFRIDTSDDTQDYLATESFGSVIYEVWINDSNEIWASDPFDTKLIYEDTVDPLSDGVPGIDPWGGTYGTGSGVAHSVTLGVFGGTPPAPPPTIIDQPDDVTQSIGGSATFTVVASDATTYLWMKGSIPLSDGGSLSGTTTDSMTINPVSMSDAGDYRCFVSGSGGSVFSDYGTLSVGDPLIISVNPSSQTVDEFNPVTFTVVASGGSPLSYQWRKDTVNISGATSSSYTISSVSNTDEGDYDCVVTNIYGSDTSSAATLTVNVYPRDTTLTVPSAEMCSSVTFTLSVTADPPVTYQWYLDGNAISGATSNSCTISKVSIEDRGYYSCKATNNLGEILPDAIFFNPTINGYILDKERDVPDNFPTGFDSEVIYNTVNCRGRYVFLDNNKVIIYIIDTDTYTTEIKYSYYE